MAVRTRVLAGGRLTTNNTVQVVFTCPADRTAILKDVRLRLQGAAGVLFVGIGFPGAAPVVIRSNFAGGLADVDAFLDPPPWIVLEETQTLYFFSAAAIQVDYWFSGTLLDGDPS